MNKRQITGGKTSSNKIEEKRGNTPPMINLRFGARALPLNPKVRRKAERVNHWRTIISSSAITDIKWGPRPGYEYFNVGSSEIQKDFLAPDFYLIVFFPLFLLFNKRILLSILLTQTQQFRIFFYCGSIVFVEDIVFGGEGYPVSCVDT